MQAVAQTTATSPLDVVLAASQDESQKGFYMELRLVSRELAEKTPSNGKPLLAAGLVSPPPAGIFVVVGEDTNNVRWPE